MIKRLWQTIGRLHRCEQGAEGLEKLLIIAVVVLPLLAVLIYFRDWIAEWLSDSAQDIRDESEPPNLNLN